MFKPMIMISPEEYNRLTKEQPNEQKAELPTEQQTEQPTEQTSEDAVEQPDENKIIDSIVTSLPKRQQQRAKIIIKVLYV